MKVSDRQLHQLIGLAAILAPAVHTLTDVAEWTYGGFSAPLLWANYLAFLVIPFLMVGLYAVQRPRIGSVGLVGALLYGASFIYFAHTSMFALTERVPDYQTLWQILGAVYTMHGLMMVIGGIAFGVATYRASFFPVWTPVIFLSGIALNVLLTLADADELFQTLGSTLRNIGLIGMGWYLVTGTAASLRK